MLRNAPPSCFTSVLVNMSATKSTSRTSLPSENAMSLVAAPTSTSIHSLDKIVQNEKKNRTRTSCKEFIRCVFQIFSLVVWYIYFSITRCLLFFFSKRLLASKNYFITLFLTVMQRNFLPVSSVWCFLLFFGCRFFYT